ncbi:MAG TPA: malto-oligosyltrehalose trehalohydrolase [Thermomicrobiales bacterium]|jgi:maltooligosyltrehalose trehalohydrolase|nr:malto-oligosyltrehalose trehalohydrolase [Thermomicrobiales bacterium]
MSVESTLTDLLDRPLPPIGATITPEGVRFLVWAPNASRSVALVIEGQDDRPELERSSVGDGYWETTIAGIGAGTRYRYSLDGADPFPDPASRFQPEGVHGPSEVVDPSTYQWGDEAWTGLDASTQAIYELHVGTYTPEGTYAALTAEIPALRDLGITAIELMPLAESPGRWNWGYDGVDLWAPSHNYGTPDELRALVDTAHQHGIGVIIDLVYNHFGPDGNYLRAYADHYFTDRHTTPWGDAVNYDAADSQPVRDFVVGNAAYWVEEFHVDGYRLDATHAILDDSPVHVVTELIARGRATAAPRELVAYLENEHNDVGLVRTPLEGGWGADGFWADDFHHEMHVFLTGERDGYFSQYDGTPASIANVLMRGLTYEGQLFDGEPRGTKVTGEPGSAFVFCVQNHDQVGNRAVGDRLHTQTSRERYHAASTLFLLAPETPLIWMGQEFRASAPFQYFTDHEPGLGKLVTEGRRKEFAHFQSFGGETEVPDPQAESTFRDSTLDLSERETNGDTYELYQDLLHLIRDDEVLAQRDRAGSVALAKDDVILLYRQNGDAHRLLLANFGPETRFTLAGLDPRIIDPPRGVTVLLDTGNERYGGGGTAAVAEGGVRLPADTAVLLGW